MSSENIAWVIGNDGIGVAGAIADPRFEVEGLDIDRQSRTVVPKRRRDDVGIAAAIDRPKPGVQGVNFNCRTTRAQDVIRVATAVPPPLSVVQLLKIDERRRGTASVSLAVFTIRIDAVEAVQHSPAAGAATPKESASVTAPAPANNPFHVNLIIPLRGPLDR